MIDAVVKDVWVPATPEAAFRRFTTELNTWWPRETHSVSKEKCVSVGFEERVGGRMLERDEAGVEYEWGAIEAWDPPHRFQVSWHPGRSVDQAQRVEVTFTPLNDGTAVRLTHSGWEILGDEALKTRTSYDNGWPAVLSIFLASLEGGA